jgi:hypothetical protein
MVLTVFIAAVQLAHADPARSADNDLRAFPFPIEQTYAIRRRRTAGRKRYSAGLGYDNAFRKVSRLPDGIVPLEDVISGPLEESESEAHVFRGRLHSDPIQFRLHLAGRAVKPVRREKSGPVGDSDRPKDEDNRQSDQELKEGKA